MNIIEKIDNYINEITDVKTYNFMADYNYKLSKTFGPSKNINKITTHEFLRQDDEGVHKVVINHYGQAKPNIVDWEYYNPQNDFVGQGSNIKSLQKYLTKKHG